MFCFEIRGHHRSPAGSDSSEEDLQKIGGKIQFEIDLQAKIGKNKSFDVFGSSKFLKIEI